MKNLRLGVFSAVLSLLSLPVQAQRPNYYLFYNIDSPHLDEIDIKRREIAQVFDDEFGPAADTLPKEVRISDYFVAKYPDGSYVFMLDAPFNCGQLGCNTRVYQRDAQGDLERMDSGFPVKCEFYEVDKELCLRAGYRKKVSTPKKKKGPAHYPAPRGTY